MSSKMYSLSIILVNKIIEKHCLEFKKVFKSSIQYMEISRFMVWVKLQYTPRSQEEIYYNKFRTWCFGIFKL